MEAMQPRICIQPQSRRSPRYYITMIIRAPSRVFQFQDSQHSFKDCMDYMLPGLHWKRFTTPCRWQHYCSLHRCGFSLFNCISSSFFSFYSIFWQKIRIFISAGRTDRVPLRRLALRLSNTMHYFASNLSKTKNSQVSKQVPITVGDKSLFVGKSKQ